MADPASATVLTDPGHRGGLEVRDRAVQNIVVAAALTSPGVLRHGGGLGKLAGRDLPRVSVEVAGDHVTADIDIAVQWGRPLHDVAAATSQAVRDALSVQSGLTADRIRVHVATVIPPGHAGAPERTVA